MSMASEIIPALCSLSTVMLGNMAMLVILAHMVRLVAVPLPTTAHHRRLPPLIGMQTVMASLLLAMLTRMMMPVILAKAVEHHLWPPTLNVGGNSWMA